MKPVHALFFVPGGRQTGVTLVELMVSMVIGLLIAMAATALLVSTKSAYVAQDDDAHLQDTGRYALEIITRAVRQAAYENWDSSEAPVIASAIVSANLAGLDAASLKATSDGMSSPWNTAVNGSDVLAIRFFGSGQGAAGDGTMLNCAGFSVPAAASHADASESRGWSIFYVAVGPAGEPELYCKYEGKNKWSAQAIARGVESFQVLYGLDTDADGLPNRLLTASELAALDDDLVLVGADPEEKAEDRNRKTHWKKVVLVKFALLVRGIRNADSGKSDSRYDLFGVDYGDARAATDMGTRIDVARLPAPIRSRSRRIFTSTIQLRNHSAGSGT